VTLGFRGTNDACEIYVTNEGRGLTSGEIARLFNRFERTAHSRKSKIQGIGLGLYITKGLVEAHGGAIGVESVAGGTTTFTVRLPSTSSGVAH
jgi:signal transduction histidine kinase